MKNNQILQKKVWLYFFAINFELFVVQPFYPALVANYFMISPIEQNVCIPTFEIKYF